MRFGFLLLDRFDISDDVSRDASSEDDLIAALDEARHLTAHSAELVPGIADVLRQAGSDRLRNAAALTLADLGDPRGVEIIVETLRRPDIAKAAGTLIHALDEMDAMLPMDILASIVMHGSYEARAMALSMLDDGRVSGLDPLSEAAARVSFKTLAASDDIEGAEAARAALDGLDDFEPAVR